MPIDPEAITKSQAEAYHLNDAILAEQSETHMSLRDAFRAYPQAIFWSWAISACLIMEGYDTVRAYKLA